MPTEGIDIAAVLAFIADNEPLHATLLRFAPNDHAGLRAALRRAHLSEAATVPSFRPAATSSVRSAAAPSVRAAQPFEDAGAVPSSRAAEPSKDVQPGPAPTRASATRMVVYSDGASRGNPGLSGAGWVICEPAGKTIAKGAMFLGHRTNNEAEYLAAAMGIQAACDLGAQEVVLRADSELMVRQLQGRYQVRNAKLLPLFAQIKLLRKSLRAFYAEHVPREQNAAADAQANIAIDER